MGASGRREESADVDLQDEQEGNALLRSNPNAVGQPFRRAETELPAFAGAQHAALASPVRSGSCLDPQ